MTSLQEHRLRMRSDIGIIAASVFFAVYLVAGGILEQAFSALGDLFLLGAFFAGIFFTSVFTVFPAMAVLGELATQAPLFPIALAGATGAAIGDFVIFKFLRDHILGDFRTSFLRRGKGGGNTFFICGSFAFLFRSSVRL